MGQEKGVRHTQRLDGTTVREQRKQGKASEGRQAEVPLSLEAGLAEQLADTYRANDADIKIRRGKHKRRTSDARTNGGRRTRDGCIPATMRSLRFRMFRGGKANEVAREGNTRRDGATH